MQDIELEQPFSTLLQVHNASSDPVENLILSLPAEEIPGLRLMVIADLPLRTTVQPLHSNLPIELCAFEGRGGGEGRLHAAGMCLLVAPYTCRACLLDAQTTQAVDVQGLPGEVDGELQPMQSKKLQCDFLPLHEGLVRFPLLQLMSSADGRIHDVLAEDAYVTAGGE